jgi:hypothetical protein
VGKKWASYHVGSHEIIFESPIAEMISPESYFAEGACMKVLTMFLAPMIVVGLASTASARDYRDLVAEGYRWVKIDGPYACPTKEELSPSRKSFDKLWRP